MATRTCLLVVALLLAGCTERDSEAPIDNGSVAPQPAEAVKPTLQRAAPDRAAASAPTHPCLIQDGEPLEVEPLRAVGTEPFWGARIEGRCVTYSHPDDQQGTRLWTRFSRGPDGSNWSGAYGGQRFELRTRAAPGCSDGMSDRRYPLAVDLIVDGEERTGCAESLSPDAASG